MIFPTVTLSTGLRVANFSSPHSFRFTDGSVLPSCSFDHSDRGKLDTEEVDAPGLAGTTDVTVRWKLSDGIRELMAEAEATEGVDIFLVPLPFLTALKEAGLPIGRYRVVRVADRNTKTIHTDRFCV